MAAEVYGEIKQVRAFKYATGDKGASITVEFPVKGHEKMIGELVEMFGEENKLIICAILREEEYKDFMKKREKK